MGEEEKKIVSAEEAKKQPQPAKEEEAAPKGGKEEKPTAAAEKKNQDSDKKTEEPAATDDQAPPPPPPPQEIVLRVYMHCEGCARKVKKCLRGFQGVEDVITDCKTHKVIVKGERADPLKVLERVQRKSHRNVELLSPIPKPPEAAAAASEEKEPVKAEDDKPKVITVVLKVHMHCEACAQEIKKRIERIKEVEVATPNLKSSEVTVKGTFEVDKLVEYVYKRTGKHAVVVKQDPSPPPAEAPAEANKKEEGKAKEEAAEKEAKKGDSEGEAKKGDGDGDGDGGAAEEATEDGKVVEMRANEYYYYPPKHALEMYAYPYPPPQIFSDENPNACSIM
ncbi:Heavy metal-associated isoprenylated plant protein 7-like protein [Drosera capensis]